MSTEEQMQYLIGPQTLRNKDYVTIPRSEYEKMVSAYEGMENLKTMTRSIRQKEIDLNRREKELTKTEMRIKYECHKKVLDFAKTFIIK